jgi:hypothetical protein
MVVSLENAVSIVFEQYRIVCVVARCCPVELMSVCWPGFSFPRAGALFLAARPDKQLYCWWFSIRRYLFVGEKKLDGENFGSWSYRLSAGWLV